MDETITINDFNIICRTCLCRKDDLYAISEVDNFPQILANITTIKLDENGILPNKICYECMHIATIASLYRAKCEKSDAILQTILDTEHLINSVRSNEEITNFMTEIKKQNDTSARCETITAVDNNDKQNSGLAGLNLSGIDLKESIINNTLDITDFDMKISPNNDSLQPNKTQIPNIDNNKSMEMITQKIKDITENGVSIQNRIRQLETSKPNQNTNSTVTNNKTSVASVKYKENISENENLNLNKKASSGCLLPLRNGRPNHNYAVSVLRKHLKHIEKTEEKFLCEICDKYFKLKDELRSHMWHHVFTAKYKQRSHNDWNTKRHNCVYCDKSFPSKRDRQKHEKEHVADWNLSCKICKRLTSQSDLAAHKRAHFEKPYMCHYPSCNKMFKEQKCLTVHFNAVHVHSDKSKEPKLSLEKMPTKTKKRRKQESEKPESEEMLYYCNICNQHELVD